MCALSYPPPADLKEIERKTLLSIQKMGCLKKDFSGLVLAAQQNYLHLDPKRGSLNFSANFEVETAKQRRRVDVGAKIDVNAKNQYESVSYFFAIGSDTIAKDHILRKLHFDFEALENRNANECKPSIHMQICGELTPSMAHAGYTNKHLENHFPWFEKPRVPSIPFSLALLLDWLFLEFSNTPEVNQVVKDGQWRNMVLETENQLLGPYFEACHQYLRNKQRNGLFFANYLYGLAV